MQKSHSSKKVRVVLQDRRIIEGSVLKCDLYMNTIISKSLELHSHLQKAKDVLTDVMSQNTDFEHSIAGQKTGPEGFVAHNKGNTAKFVNRKEFSKMNLLGYGAIAGKKQDETI
jgi:small nuclear ribonucleoprotein (snRNP)-like protein